MGVIITQSDTIHLGLRVPRDLYALITKVSEDRGEDISSFARRAILKALAELSYLPADQKKALGVAVTPEAIA